jgi:hypothetical protein
VLQAQVGLDDADPLPQPILVFFGGFDDVHIG